MLSEGTLLSGGEKDRKIIAWDSLQNYKKVTETKVIIKLPFNGNETRMEMLTECVFSSQICSVELEAYILRDLVGTMETYTLEPREITLLKAPFKEGSIRYLLVQIIDKNV